MTNRIERKELYDAIWAEPATTIAARLGITSTALAKACRKLGVPTPPRGYWARVAAGQTPRRTPLPRSKSDQPDQYLVAGGPPREPTKLPPHLADERSRSPIVMPPAGVALHPLLEKYEARLRRRSDDPIERTAVHSIDIDVSRAQLDRALRVMHALLCALDARKFPVDVVRAGEGAPAHTTFVTIDGARLAFGLREERRRVGVPDEPDPPSVPESDPDAWRSLKTERARAEAYAASLLARRQPSPPRPSTAPRHVTERTEWSGVLTFWIDPMMHLPGAGPRTFSDSEMRGIDERLGTFVLRLRSLAVAVEEQRARMEVEARRRDEEAAQREEAERLRRAREHARAHEERLRNELENRAAMFRRAQDIRALLAAMQLDADASARAVSWATWAVGYASALEREAREPPAAWNDA